MTLLACIKLLTVFIFVSIGVACGIQNEKRDLQAFDAHTARGKELLVDGSEEDAFEQYKKAHEIATRIDWVSGQITTKIDMADIRSGQKNFTDAEKLLLEVKAKCTGGHRCSHQDLELVWNSLMFLYVYSTQDISKANALAEEIVGKTEGVDVQERRRILEKYASWMRGSGFLSEAASLETQVNNLGG